MMAISGDGRVVQWGCPLGGRSIQTCAVQDQLRKVQHIQGRTHAFAAVLAGGHVATWGTAAFGGYSSSVQDQLRNGQ